MVQSISSAEFSSVLAPVDKTSAVDNEEIKNAFGAALAKAEESQQGTSASSGKKDTDSLMDELKKMTQGMTVCGKCGTIYRGTAVAICAKCGHDMKEDSENASKMQGNSGVASSQAASVSASGLASIAKK